MSLGPEGPIQAPNPGAPGQSLLRAATVIDHTAPPQPGPGASTEEVLAAQRGAADAMRWANGFSFQPWTCADAAVIDPCADDPTGMDDDPNRGENVDYTPFVVDAHDTCSTFGWQAADYEAKALQMIAARESKAIAHELWTGALISTNQHLAAGGAVTTVGTGLAPLNGLSTLSQALADNNAGVGMLHMRPRMLEILVATGDLRYENGKWYTSRGSVVVADDGYPGTGPTGQAIAGTTEWVFGTDLVEVHRGPVVIPNAPNTYQAVDHRTNTQVVRAQRFAAAIFNGCALVAASITIPTTA